MKHLSQSLYPKGALNYLEMLVKVVGITLIHIETRIALHSHGHDPRSSSAHREANTTGSIS